MRPIFLAALFLMFSVQVACAVPSNHEEQKITVNGAERSYLIHYPNPMPTKITSGLPVVIALHGGGGNGEQMAKSSRFNAKADKAGFIAVYPNGSGRRDDKLLTWNASKCCAYAMRQNIDDIAFIDALIDKLVKFQGADPKRIYITGMSNGGMMAHRLGAALAPKVAAIGVVAGTIFSDQPIPSVPVSTIMIHGLADDSVPFNGGESKRPMIRAAMDSAGLPIKSVYDFWRKNNGCAVDEDIYTKGNITTYSSKVCKNRTVVSLQTIKNGGHNWPGSPKAIYNEFDDGSSYFGHDATDVLWDFFANQRKYP
jgi:polyhydroxybutyrate depolymerase